MPTEGKMSQNWNIRTLFVAFAVVMAFVVLGGLAWLIFDKFERSDLVQTLSVVATEEAKSTSVPTETPVKPLRTSIHDGLTASDLPPGLPDDTVLVGPSEVADIVFLHHPPRRIVKEWYVPVVSMGVGIDALTSESLLKILMGSIINWSEVGGISGPIRVVTGPFDQLQPINELFNFSIIDQFGSYEELFETMSFQSGTIALVPLDQVVPSVTALAIDGVDIVRGSGESRDWKFVDAVFVFPLTDRGKPAVERLMDSPLPVTTTIVVTGDILPVRCSLTALKASGDWASALRGKTGEYLAAADLTLGSYDGSIHDLGEHYGCVPGVNLSSPPEVIELLKYAGFDELTLATNHVGDCGISAPCGFRALLSTIKHLEDAEIEIVGAGLSLEHAFAPVIFTVGGTTFGILAFDDVAAQNFSATSDSPGTAPLDDDYSDEIASGNQAYFEPASALSLNRFTKMIGDLSEVVDVVIVQVQTGTEDTHDPSGRSIKALRAARSAGATLIIGNQAHHVQAIEPLQEDGFIAYALGNFIFDQIHTPEHSQGYLLEATFWGDKLANLRFLPYEIKDRYRPVLVDGSVRLKILNDVFEATKRLLSAN